MTRDVAERLSRVALACLVEPGHPELGLLVRRHGPSAALDLLLASQMASVQLTDSVGDRRVAAERPSTVEAAHAIAAAALAATQRLGARVITPEDDEWPTQLDEVASTPGPDDDACPPLCLWAHGALSAAEALDRSVALVGARAPTSYGQHVAADLALGLADRDWTTVSGADFGIAAAAHRGALAAGARAVAVLASGIDRPYPSAHAALFQQLADQGLLLSAWPPGATPHRRRFLRRNQMIAALTRGTVLVEAGVRSNARSTLQHARQLNRPTMAVPGPVTSALSVGCHAELREYPQTQLVRDVVDVIAELLAPPDHAA